MTDVLTLRLDDESQAFFERLRQLHYPAERNQIAAHLTLFHTLPRSAEVSAALAAIVARQRTFTMMVSGLRSLGRGVAYMLASPDLQALHAELAAAFAGELTAQDRQRFQPHVVVQNKVTPERAWDLLATLERGFQAFAVEARGIDLWHYLGGPWELSERFVFSNFEPAR